MPKNSGGIFPQPVPNTPNFPGNNIGPSYGHYIPVQSMSTIQAGSAWAGEAVQAQTNVDKGKSLAEVWDRLTDVERGVLWAITPTNVSFPMLPFRPLVDYAHFMQIPKYSAIFKKLKPIMQQEVDAYQKRIEDWQKQQQASMQAHHDAIQQAQIALGNKIQSQFQTMDEDFLITIQSRHSNEASIKLTILLAAMMLVCALATAYITLVY